jgi:hypothetical protein
MMDDLLLLVILGSYFLMLCVLAFIAGQLLILVVEYLADWLERRPTRAAKQAKAMPHRAKTYR